MAAQQKQEVEPEPRQGIGSGGGNAAVSYMDGEATRGTPLARVFVWD